MEKRAMDRRTSQAKLDSGVTLNAPPPGAMCLSVSEDECAEMFRDVVGIAVLDAGGLPAEEVALGVGAEALDAVEIDTPPSAALDLA